MPSLALQFLQPGNMNHTQNNKLRMLQFHITQSTIMDSIASFKIETTVEPLLKELSKLRTQYKKNLPIKDKFCSPNGTMLIHFYL